MKPAKDVKKAVAKDKYFTYASYSVLYNVDVTKKDKQVLKQDDLSDVCFARMLSKMRACPVEENNIFSINMNIKVKKALKDSTAYESNTTILSKEQIEEYLTICNDIFCCKDLTLTELSVKGAEYFNIHIEYESVISNIIILLSTIRFFWEVPYQNCLWLVLAYTKNNQDKKDYFMYILNTLICYVVYFRGRGTGHLYFNLGVFKKFTNDYLKECLLSNDLRTGYEFSDKYLITLETSYFKSSYQKRTNAISLFYNKFYSNYSQFISMLNSYYDLTNLTLYSEIQNSINNLFNDN